MKLYKIAFAAVPLVAALGASVAFGDPISPETPAVKPAQADEEESLGLDNRFQIDAQLRTDVLVKKDAAGKYRSNLREEQSYVRLTTRITENIRAVITTQLDRDLITDGRGATQTFDVENFIKEAYTEVRQVGGQPIAFVIGKQPIPFGQRMLKLPMSRPENPTERLTREEEVFGFTVALDYNFFNLIDKVEMSVFETEAGDLQIGKVDGASIRLSKQLTEKLKLTMSYMHLGNGHDKSLESEDRGTIGLVYTSGAWTAWVEGIAMTNNRDNPNSDYAVTAGVARKLGPGEIAVEASYIQNSLTQLGLGYRMNVTKNLSIGPEVRYTWYDDSTHGARENELQAGVSAVVKLGSSSDNCGKVLFGKGCQN